MRLDVNRGVAKKVHFYCLEIIKIRVKSILVKTVCKMSV